MVARTASIQLGLLVIHVNIDTDGGFGPVVLWQRPVLERRSMKGLIRLTSRSRFRLSPFSQSDGGSVC